MLVISLASVAAKARESFTEVPLFSVAVAVPLLMVAVVSPVKVKPSSAVNVTVAVYTTLLSKGS